MAELYVFALACILLIITPGPGVLSVAGVGSGFGFAKGSLYLWGLCLGNFLVALTVASGIAATVFATPYVRELLLVISILYMLYLALKIAFAGSKVGFIEADKAPKFRDGLALQAVNPKAYVANSFLFSGFPILPDNILVETAIKLVVWVAIWIPIHFGWLMAGIGLRQMNLSPSVQRAINMIMAISMIAVVLLALVVDH
ncbi:MAG: LysE family translocator [Pseudomonadota bacterium]